MILLKLFENWSKSDRIRQIKLEETIHIYEDDRVEVYQYNDFNELEKFLKDIIQTYGVKYLNDEYVNYDPNKNNCSIRVSYDINKFKIKIPKYSDDYNINIKRDIESIYHHSVLNKFNFSYEHSLDMIFGIKITYDKNLYMKEPIIVKKENSKKKIKQWKTEKTYDIFRFDSSIEQYININDAKEFINEMSEFVQMCCNMDDIGLM